MSSQFYKNYIFFDTSTIEALPCRSFSFNKTTTFHIFSMLSNTAIGLKQ